MQPKSELIALIMQGRPDIDETLAETWAMYLRQLKGCKLYSVTAQEFNEEKWLKARRVGIGGSEIAAVRNNSPWSSPRHVWLSKMGVFDDKPPSQSEAARWGNLLEDTVAREWAKREDRRWIHIPVILIDEEKPWLMANIDGFTLDEHGLSITGILEVKTTSAYNEDPWAIGPLPDYYLDQVNWYCGITRLTQFTIICLVGGQKLYYYDLPADPERFAACVAAGDDFWLNYVEAKIEPEAVATDKDLLQAMAAEENQEQDLPPLISVDDVEANNVVDSYCQLREQISALNKVKDALYAQIWIKLDKHSEMLTAQRTVKIKLSTRRGCNYDKLLLQYPQAYNDCVTASESRSLEVK